MVVGCLLAGVSVTGTVHAAPSAARVGTDGTGPTLDDRAWWPAGMNAYQLATDW